MLIFKDLTIRINLFKEVSIQIITILEFRCKEDKEIMLWLTHSQKNIVKLIKHQLLSDLEVHQVLSVRMLVQLKIIWFNKQTTEAWVCRTIELCKWLKSKDSNIKNINWNQKDRIKGAVVLVTITTNQQKWQKAWTVQSQTYTTQKTYLNQHRFKDI